MKILECPVCNSTEFYIEGEYVDIGVGLIKCSPDICEKCGYIESNGLPNQLPYRYYKERWDSGTDPIESPPKLTRGLVKTQYQDWISENIGDDLEKNYGKCQDWAREMKITFPELQTVYGKYYCTSWGERFHFFLYDPDGYIIVDPTAAQFPSKGFGIYTITYPIDIFTMERTDYKCFDNY